MSKTKNRLSALLDQVRQAETVIIVDRGTPVARIDALRPARPRARQALR